MTPLGKQFEPSKDRLIYNARRMMLSAQNPAFQKVWQKIYLHLLKQYKKLN